MSIGVTQPIPVDIKLDDLARSIADWQERWTRLWHEEKDRRPVPNPFAMDVQEQHRRNFDLWHEEDQARDPSADDATIAAVKRRIDKLNQERNNLIEKLDDDFMTMIVQRRVQPPADATWNTETPGAVVDRLSILSLKIFHMAEQEQRTDADEAHREKCAAKRKILEQQREDLVAALQVLIADLFAGRKKMKQYRQFKMYNDPALNPEIYKHRSAGR